MLDAGFPLTDPLDCDGGWDAGAGLCVDQLALLQPASIERTASGSIASLALSCR